MKKKIRVGFIFVVILGLGYITYTIVLKPSVFNAPLTLVEDYLSNLSDPEICESHFNTETTEVCTVFTEALKSEEVTVTQIVASGNIVVVELSVSTTISEFTFTLKEEETGGIRGFIHKQKYLIDTIE